MNVDINPLVLKLYFAFVIQNQGVSHLARSILEQENREVLEKNTIYVQSLLSDEQKGYWPVWIKELLSEDVHNFFKGLDTHYGVMSDINKTITHINEIIPETKTVLIIE